MRPRDFLLQLVGFAAVAAAVVATANTLGGSGLADQRMASGDVSVDAACGEVRGVTYIADPDDGGKLSAVAIFTSSENGACAGARATVTAYSGSGSYTVMGSAACSIVGDTCIADGIDGPISAVSKLAVTLAGP